MTLSEQIQEIRDGLQPHWEVMSDYMFGGEGTPEILAHSFVAYVDAYRKAKELLVQNPNQPLDSDRIEVAHGKAVRTKRGKSVIVEEEPIMALYTIAKEQGTIPSEQINGLFDYVTQIQDYLRSIL